jgi:hypothetical protein
MQPPNSSTSSPNGKLAVPVLNAAGPLPPAERVPPAKAVARIKATRDTAIERAG